MPCSQRRFQNRCGGGFRFHPYMMGGGFPPFHPFFMAEGEEEEQATLMNLFQKNKTTWNESEETYIFQMDVPGVKPHQITIEEKDGEMEVTAIRMSNESEIAKTHQEILYVSPSMADFANAVATLDDGVLTITVPKKSNEPVDIETQTTSPPEAAVDGKEFCTSMDLPGVKASDLKTQARQGKVHVEATRKVGDRTVTIRRIIDVQPSVDVSNARGFLQDGVFTLVAPTQDDNDDSKPAGMRTISVTTNGGEVPDAFASLCLNDNQEDMNEAMVVETVVEGDEGEWEKVDQDAKKSAEDKD